MSKKIICPECKGRGWNPNGSFAGMWFPSTCPTCGGTGEVQYE